MPLIDMRGTGGEANLRRVTRKSDWGQLRLRCLSGNIKWASWYRRL